MKKVSPHLDSNADVSRSWVWKLIFVLFVSLIRCIISERVRTGVCPQCVRRHLALWTGVGFDPVQCNIFHMVRNPRGQDWEARPDLPIGTIDRDALTRRIMQGLKYELEYSLERVGVDFSLEFVGRRGLWKLWRHRQ